MNIWPISADEVTEGSVKVSPKYGSLPINKHAFDPCKLLQYMKKTCPLPKGSVEVVENITQKVKNNNIKHTPKTAI